MLMICALPKQSWREGGVGVRWTAVSFRRFLAFQGLFRRRRVTRCVQAGQLSRLSKHLQPLKSMFEVNESLVLILRKIYILYMDASTMERTVRLLEEMRIRSGKKASVR